MASLYLFFKACMTREKPSHVLLCVASMEASSLLSGPLINNNNQNAFQLIAGLWSTGCSQLWILCKLLVNSGMQVVALLSCCIKIWFSRLCVSSKKLPQPEFIIQAWQIP